MTEGYDSALVNVIFELFPEVDPVTWALTLVFVLLPYDPDKRMQSIIERPWKRVSMGRPKGFSGDSATGMEQVRSQNELERKKTFELIFILANVYPQFRFSKENLNNFIEELEQLKYVETTEEEMKRRSFLRLFNDIKPYIEAE